MPRPVPRPAQSEEQQQQHHLQHSQRHHAVPGPSSSAPNQRNQTTSSPKIQRHHAVPGPSSSAPNQRNQTTSSPKIQRHQAVHRRTSSSAAATGSQRQHSVGNNVAASTMAPPKLIRSSPSPSLSRRHYHDEEQHQQQLQHRGSVASSVAALATVLAAAPTSLRNNTNNNNEQLRRSRQRPLAVPEATEATPQNQYFLAVPGSSASGGLSSSLSASISMVPGSGGGWTSQPASPMLADRPLPPLFSASSCSPLPTTNNHQLNHHHREHVQQYHRRHDAAVLSEPNVSRSAKQQQQPPLMPFLRSLRQLKLFKRRSVSELSLVLELLRGGGTIFGGGRAETDDGASDGYSTHNGAEDEELELDNSELSQHRHNRFRHHTASPMPASGVERHRHATVRRTATTLTRRTTQRSQQRRTRRRFPWAHYSPGAIQRRFVHVQEEKAMLQAPTAPIDASKFVAYVQERRKKRILFKGEFLMIQRSVDPQRCTTEVGVRMGERNQYPDTLPYDHNRVVLELRPGVDDSHYINASYVNSWLREKAYVVTQSVRSKQASNELWRTVWELGANTMVMLTKIFDFMRVMCLQYWPQTHFQFGEIHVETMETQTYAHFVIRTFRLRKTCGPEASADGTAAAADAAAAAAGAAPCEEQRIVKHFHFTEWELNSFPYISAFIELRRRVRQWMERSPVDAPIVVHCSNGGGRSGAFLALDANLELLQRTGQLDVYEYGRTLANSRQHLVDTVDQYMFIYDVLCEAVLCSLQPIGMHQLKNRSGMYKARKDRELMEVQDSHENKLLLMLTAPLRIGDCAGGHRLENRGKNRDVMVVPPDHARPYLQTLHGESKDYTYINAVEVDGFTRKSEFIVTEWPKVPTLDSFWTLVFDHNVHTVICLTNQPTDIKQYPQFVHNKGKRNYGPFTVEIVNYQQYPGLQSHMVKISKRPMDEVIERRKWLWSRKKGDRRDALDAGSARSTGGHHHRRVRRRPTLSNFLAECERYRRRNSSMATGSGSAAGGGLPIDDVNFRLQQRYWGKIHRRTPTPKSSSSSSSSSSSNTSCTTSGSRSSSCCSTHTTRTHSPSLCSNCTRSSASRPSPLLEGEKVGHVHGQPGSDLIGDEHQQQQQLVVDEEENELLGVRRKTSRLRAAVRPLSTSALPDPPCTPTMPTAPGGMPIRKKSSGGVQMLFRGGSDQRTKRDSRGRRLGGEWDKRLERRGDDVVALFDERGVGAASGTREREQLDNDDAATMAHAETGTTTTGYMSTLRRSTVTTTAARRRRLSRRRKRRERRMARTFSQPNLGTLERFEKTFMISEIMATGASQQQLEAEVRLCCIIQVKMWPMENKVPLSTTALIEVLKMTRSWRKRAPDRPEQRPTIVMSHNGVSRCGIFIAANVCIDQMEMDHEVDVFHAVKMIRLNRPQLIDMKDEYKYLYDLMLHWYMTSPELRQFEPPEMSVVSDAEEEASDGDASLGGGAPLMTRSQGGSTRRRPGSIRHDGQGLARSKSNRASSRHGSKSAAAVSIQRVPTINSGTNNNNTLAVSGGALARNASSMSGTSAGSRKREPVYLN